MALDDYTRELRRRHLGSSDAAAVVGRDPWRSAWDVWAEKTGRLGPERAPTPAMQAGTYLEPAVLGWAEDEIGSPLTRSVFRVGADESRCANFDAVAFELPAVVEAKTSGLLSRGAHLAEYGAAGTDELPAHVLLQVHHQLVVAREQEDWPTMDIVLVPVLLIGVGFVLYQVPRNPDLCDALVEAEERFWRDHVLADVPPPDALPSSETIARLTRVPGAAVPIDEAVVQDWLAARAAAKAATAAAEEAQRAALAALGEAELGTCALGTLSYRQQARAAYTAPATTYRVARFTPARPPKGEPTHE